MKIAQIAYTNTAPFFQGWPEDQFPLEPGVPTELAQKAHDGEILAGPIPLVECWRLENDFEPLLDFGISSREKSHSVLVFSKVPFAELNLVQIGVTRESATSVALCQILIEQRYNNSVRFRKTLQMSDAAWLVIGDQALTMAQSHVGDWSYVTDLATEWWDWQQLPFVFARWIIRRDAEPALKEKLEQTLSARFEHNMKNISAVASLAAKRIDLKPALIEKYLTDFEYHLASDAGSAMSLFREMNQRSVVIRG